MLSYIDIEAFATASYPTVAKTSSVSVQIEASTPTTTSTVSAAQKRKQIAKRMMASARQDKLQLRTAAA